MPNKLPAEWEAASDWVSTPALACGASVRSKEQERDCSKPPALAQSPADLAGTT